MSSKITVVTVCYNAASVIEKTIKSVLSQRTDYPCIEYIIVDGKSNDGTINFINKYMSEIDILISEPDNGIYDAMNKAVSVATGDYIVFMNAGDVFYNRDTIKQIAITSNLQADVIYGNHATFFSADTGLVKSYTSPITKLKYGMVFNHQSSMVRKEILLKNPFDIHLLSADYAFFYKCFLDGFSFYKCNMFFSVFDANGVSSNNKIRIYREWRKVSTALNFELNVYFYYTFLLFYSTVKKWIFK
ncbi:glycosyltransferase family 2 protein [Aeromonas veronii]|uniref:glycosyltransferase family 2 protein n=1 Tax=Aeromonas veronii TaxID=654 RepID=UPI001396B16D|nr:glycosyltransferase family 2 protein [Aeromonas veronii]